MFWKLHCYLLGPSLLFFPALSGWLKWPLYCTLPLESTAPALAWFLTPVRLWEMRTVSVFGVGWSGAWSLRTLPPLITWESRLLTSRVMGTIDLSVSLLCRRRELRFELRSLGGLSHQLLLVHLNFLCFRSSYPQFSGASCCSLSPSQVLTKV